MAQFDLREVSMVPWVYVGPAAAAVAMAMLAGHWCPLLHESRAHNVIRYAWGLGWILAAMIGLPLAAPTTGIQAGVAALVVFALAAGLGTVLGYAIDRDGRNESQARQYMRGLHGRQEHS